MRRSCTRSWGAWRSSIRTFACWTRLRRRWRRRGIRDWRWRNASGGGGASEERRNEAKKTGREVNAEAQRKHRVKKRKEKDGARLTTADLVLLSLLAERPMHGYQANAELVRREVQDWAGISRPQVYYSLEKLARMGMLRAAADKKESEGPERQVYAVTARGTEALADALEREEWTTGRERPACLTWMALWWQARRGVFAWEVRRRGGCLLKEL